MRVGKCVGMHYGMNGGATMWRWKGFEKEGVELYCSQRRVQVKQCTLMAWVGV